MPLLWTGVLMVILKWLQIGPVALWPWWGVLSPFIAAVVWFEWLETPLAHHRWAARWRASENGRTVLPARFGGRSRLK